MQNEQPALAQQDSQHLPEQERSEMGGIHSGDRLHHDLPAVSQAKERDALIEEVRLRLPHEIGPITHGFHSQSAREHLRWELDRLTSDCHLVGSTFMLSS